MASAGPMRGNSSEAKRVFVRQALVTQWLCHADARQVFDLPAWRLKV